MVFAFSLTKQFIYLILAVIIFIAKNWAFQSLLMTMNISEDTSLGYFVLLNVSPLAVGIETEEGIMIIQVVNKYNLNSRKIRTLFELSVITSSV